MPAATAAAGGWYGGCPHWFRPEVAPDQFQGAIHVLQRTNDRIPHGQFYRGEQEWLDNWLQVVDSVNLERSKLRS
jgi:hypothetical protein